VPLHSQEARLSKILAEHGLLHDGQIIKSEDTPPAVIEEIADIAVYIGRDASPLAAAVLDAHLSSASLPQNHSFYFYDEPTYATKEKELTISTEQAAYLFAESYFKDYPSEQEVTANINLIFRNKYVVSPNRIRYNAKIRRYYLTYDTYWVSGKTGKIKRNRRSVLHIDRVEKATKWNISRFYIKSFKKTYYRKDF